MGGRRRKKQSKLSFVLTAAKEHRRLSAVAIIVLLVLAYIPLHSYARYLERQKFRSTQSAMATVYDNVVSGLGQPDSVKSTATCTKQSVALRNVINCRLETDFIYGVANSNQAELIMRQLQSILKNSKTFKSTKKLSGSLSNTLVFDTYYHDALDNYSGPHHIACSVKYSYNTPDEVNLSLNNPRLKPFETFFSCSSRTSQLLYPA